MAAAAATAALAVAAVVTLMEATATAVATVVVVVVVATMGKFHTSPFLTLRWVILLGIVLRGICPLHHPFPVLLPKYIRS